MKKLLLSIVALCMCTFAFADDVTFDFDNDYATLFPSLAGTSANDSHDGDFTEDTSASLDGVTVTVSKKASGSNENRIWNSAPRLRMYSGTFTVEAASPITAIEFAGHNTNFNLTPDAGKLDGKVWTGSASKIVFSVAKNTQINSMTVYFGGDAPVAADTVEVSIKDFKAAEVSTKNWYKLTGKVSGIKSTDVYGNFDLSDGSESVYVYGLLSYNGGPAKDFQNLIAKTGLCDGSTLTLIGQRGEYGGKIEVVNAYYVSSDAEPSGVQAPVISFDEATATVTITDPSGENNTIYYTLNGAEPDDASILYEGPFVIETAVQVRAVCYNDDDQKSAITTETCIPAAAPYKTCAELVANCTATDSKTAPTVTFAFEDVIVTGINGSNVFIQDATGSFLLYGKGATFSRGDVLSGTLTGSLYSYNGLPELSVTDWNGVTATPTGAIVAPTVMNAADITAANASQFVYLQNMNFVSASTGGKHISYLFNQNGTDVTLFDQFDVLQNVVFNTEDKYNARVFVIPYKENIQYYAVATEDLEVISDKQDPETRFINIAYLQVLADGSFKIPADHYETLSDGAKTFTSSNEDVATVDNEGNVTLKSVGVAIITLTTASTAKYSEGKSTTAVSVVSHVNLAGEGEEVYISTGREIADPWEANDVNPIYVFGEGDKTGEPIFDVPQWIHGYIVGYADGALTKAAFNTEAGDKVVPSNILLSANKNTTDVNECIPVALATSPAESKAVRAALNLKDNPDNLGKEVWIYGDIMKYFSVAGVKNVTDYSLDGVTPVSISDVRSAQTADSRIYNLQGQLLAAPQKGAINIIGGKKVYVDR